MANKTVYPYGTNGHLPASIGVINDLRTGGADKALSAQQGVVLREMAQEGTAINLDEMGVIRGVIVNTNKWSGVQTNHESIQVPVTPGQTYRITANAVNNSYYAFLADVSFWSNGGTPNYAPDHAERYTLTPGTVAEITIPAGTKYIYLAITNSGADQKPQSVLNLETFVDFTDEAGEVREQVLAPGENKCDYATDDFSFTGTSSQGKIEKVGTAGYLLTNTASTTGKYFLYTLPAGLVDGKIYLISFDYKSWLSANWNLYPVEGTPSDVATPYRKIAAIPATGAGHIAFRYTYLLGDKYLRLPSNTQNAGCALLIENLSIVEDTDTVSALTARMDAIDGGQNFPDAEDLPFNKYFGRRIDLTEHGFAYREYMSSVTTHQSSACYGDYMFIFTNKMASVKMYNLRTKTALATLNLTAKDDYHHCNQAFFGTEKYDADDVFPLVYISVFNNGTTTPSSMEVYRIVPTMGDSDYSSFTITLVQTVSLPIMNSDNKLGNANFVLDADSGYLYTYSRDNTATYRVCRITKWPMPELSDGDVTFTDDDRLDYWDTDTEAVNMQGATIRNHQLFIFRGGSGVGYTEAHIFDLVRRDRTALLDLLTNGFTMEPEGVFFWGNTLCTSNTKVYRFFFK